MLQSINIKRFKSILNEKVEFGRVNLIVGGNGSGKSNLLEAIGIASAALARGIADPDLVAKGIRLSTPTLFKSAFKNRRLPSTFRIETAFSNDITYDLELQASESATSMHFNTERARQGDLHLFSRSGKGAKVLGDSLNSRPNRFRGMYDQVRSLSQFPEDVVSMFDEFGRYAIYSPQTEFLRGTEVGAAQQPPIGLHGEGLPLATASLLTHYHRLNKEHRRALDFIFDLVWATGWTNQFRVGPIDPSLIHH